ncbi:class I SAM-dependent methyltransferase [Microbacterium sp. 179-B 1A2 NHS]|uniref:class I SAM-dependent methyltransferase n=1 Tax=Microbacterium sp. 179-B 1A2 NHS TaxID=3142383 RepID=UPI0039A25946
MSDRSDMSVSFGRAAGAYQRGRPDYPADAVAWLLAPIRPAVGAPRVADVGAGTGKLTAALRRAGADVVAVDPDPGMLAALHDVLPDVPTHVGTAERLPLPDAAMDAVVLGQAWHWVDPATGSAEIGRVVRPGGVLGLIWNIRDESEAHVAAMTAVIHASNAEALLSSDGPVVAEPFGELEHRSWTWSRRATRAMLLDMVHSRSAYITAGATERQRVDRGMADVLDGMGAIGAATVDVPYATHAFRAVRAGE